VGGSIGDAGVREQPRPRLDDHGASVIQEHGGSRENHGEDRLWVRARGAQAVAVLDAPPQIHAQERRLQHSAQAGASVQDRHSGFNRLDQGAHARSYRARSRKYHGRRIGYESRHDPGHQRPPRGSGWQLPAIPRAPSLVATVRRMSWMRNSAPMAFFSRVVQAKARIDAEVVATLGSRARLVLCEDVAEAPRLLPALNPEEESRHVGVSQLDGPLRRLYHLLREPEPRHPRLPSRTRVPPPLDPIFRQHRSPPWQLGPIWVQRPKPRATPCETSRLPRVYWGLSDLR
jgi:hypothetical protein